MSTGTPRKRPASEFKHYRTLLGMPKQEQIDFAWNDLRRFFKVTLWDRDHLCKYEKCKHPEIETFEDATLDHIVPRSKGGRTRLANLQLMHAKCNSRKTNRMPARFSRKAFTPVQSNTGSVTKYMQKRAAVA